MDATETTAPAGQEPAPSTPPRAVAAQPAPLSLLPPYVFVLLLSAVLAVAVGEVAADTQRVGAAEGVGFSPEDRRLIVFGLLFTWAVGVALALAWLGELVATVVRLARRRSPGRAVVRLVLALLPAAAFAVGNYLLNPWLPALVDKLRQGLPTG